MELPVLGSWAGPLVCITRKQPSDVVHFNLGWIQLLRQLAADAPDFVPLAARNDLLSFQAFERWQLEVTC